jgi:ferredoxin
MLGPVEHTIRFLPSERSVKVASGTTLLEAARDAGLPVASSCGADGVCARCGLQILQGTESLAAETEREVRIKARNRIDPGLRLACRIELRGDLVVTAPYW